MENHSHFPSESASEITQTGVARRTLLAAAVAGLAVPVLGACERRVDSPVKPSPSESVPLPEIDLEATIYTGFSAEGLENTRNVGEAVGKRPSIISVFSSMGSEKNREFQHETLTEIRENHGAIPMMTLEPWEAGKGAEQPDYSLKEIISGRYDDYFRRWAAGAKEWGHPFFLRLMHEMNGDWYPWSVQKNGNTPEEYVAAYRHVHDIFTETGAANASWVWCVNTDYEGAAPVSSRVYPGDEYVDWVAIDAYEHKNAPENPAAIVGTMPFVVEKVSHGKPLMYGELGCVSTNPAEADIIRRFLNAKNLGKYGVKAFVWFNWQKKDGDGNVTVDYRVDDPTRPEITKVYANAVKSRTFAANTFGHVSETPIPPLGR